MNALKNFSRMIKFFVAYRAFGAAIKNLHGARGRTSIDVAVINLDTRASRLDELGRPNPEAPVASVVAQATLVARFMGRSALCFSRGDFGGAFEGAQRLWETGGPEQAAMGLNMALDALGQIKARAVKEGTLSDYATRFGLSENELMAAAKRGMSGQSPFSQKPGAEPRLLGMSDFKAALSMAAAHMKWVSGDLVEAQRWTQQAIGLYGADEIARREIQPRQDMHWFFDHIDPNNLARFRAFIDSELPPPSRAPSP